MSEIIHVYPLNDFREHECDPESANCWCKPTLDEEGICVHHAMDQREKYETGQLLPH